MQSATPSSLSPSVLCVLWLLIMIFLLLNTAFLLALAAGYFSFADNSSLFNYLAVMFLFSRSHRFLTRYHRGTAVAYTLLSVPFVLAGVRLVWYSLRRRQFAFGSGTVRQRKAALPSEASTAASTHTAPSVSTSGDSANENGKRQPMLVSARILSWLSKLRSSTSIDGAHFTSFILVTQTFELILQTIQGYRSSQFISNIRINQLYGVMIFLHCWLSPLIRYTWEIRRGQVRMARLLILLVGILLSFTWGTVLQGCLFARYWEIYQDPLWSSNLPDDYLPEEYDRELQQVLVVSFRTLVLSVFPFVTSGLVVHEICKVLDEESTSQGIATIKSGINPKVGDIGTVGSAPLQTRAPEMTSPDNLPPKRTPQAWTQRIHTAHSACTMAFGLFILITSIGSSGHLWTLTDSGLPCFHQLHPWFASTVSCIGRRVNCEELKISGAEQEIANLLERVSPLLLANLGIANCPALAIPSTIHRFTELATLQITNSTVVQWDQKAAVTDPYFREMQSLMLNDVHMQCSPMGITAHPLPQSLEWMDLESINANSFIHDVGNGWQNVICFYCIACGLQEAPRVIDTMKDLEVITLPNNSIQSLPDSMFEHKPWLRYVKLAANPIQTFPPAAWALFDQLENVIVQLTNFTEVPSSAAAIANPKLVMVGYDSPLCANPPNPLPTWLSCEPRDINSW